MQIFSMTLILLFLSITFSCSKSSSSNLQHDVGATVNEQTVAPTCTQMETDYPIETTYVKKIVNHIMTSNPKTFTGNLAFKNFCFKILNIRTTNAECHRDGTISLNLGLLTAMEKDAQVAAVLSHELAHFTLNHHNRRETEKLGNLETEADEVGNEFYRRSGFDSNEYKKMLKNSHSIEDQQKCEQQIAINKPMEKGRLDKHPDTCWRIANINKEDEEHSKIYQPLIKNQVLAGEKSNLKEIQKRINSQFAEEDQKRIISSPSDDPR